MIGGEDVQRSSVARGATVMVISVAFAKVLGVLYVIPLTQLIHNEGLGIYQNAYALYTILLTLATSGFPTAMGKMISERLALKQHAEVEQLYRVTLRLVLGFTVIAAAMTWFGAPLYSRLVALRDPAKAASSLVWSVRALAPAVLVVPIMSVWRGYLQGYQRMAPSGYSQAVEQLFRIAAMIVGAWLVTRGTQAWSLQTAASGAAAATFGAFIGALAGLVLLAVAIMPLRRLTRNVKPAKRRKTDKELRQELARIALPVCAGALVVPISGFVDSVTVQNLLMATGSTFHQATADFGILSRQAFTLIQLPLAFAMAIGASVLPAISHAKAVRDQAGIERNVIGTTRSMLFITFPTAAALLVLARPVDILLFGTTKGAAIISSVSFMGIFSSLELISTYMLQGLGQMVRPVRNMFIGVIVKVLFNIVLILPFHIMGAAIATTIGYLFSSTLNVLAVKKYGNVGFSVWRISIPTIISSLILCGVLFVCNIGTHQVLAPILAPLGKVAPRVLALFQTFLPILIGGVVYVLLSIRTRAVTADELYQLPRIGGRLARLALRLQPNQKRRYA